MRKWALADSRSGAVHKVLDARLFQQQLDLCNLGGDGWVACSNLKMSVRSSRVNRD